MTSGIRLFLAAVVIIFLQQYGYAQHNSNNHFLSEVGAIDSVYSKILNETREIYIQIPSAYSPEKNQKYPVVYILDGEVFLPTVCDVHNYYSGGFMPEMVLVGISNDKNRLRDLTTSSVKTKYGMPFNEKNGEADNFIKFVEQELIPYIENKYPVTNFRTLIGHSYGGLFSIYTLIHHPQLFSNYLAIDPSLDWDNQKLLHEAQGIVNTGKYADKSLFISLSGQLHMQDPKVTIDNVMQDTTGFTLFSRSNIAFSNIIRENFHNSISFEWKFYPNDLHGTVPFPSIRDGLISLFEWFQMENTDRINSFDTPLDELLGIIKYRVRKLQDHFGYVVPPYPEELLTMMGYMNMDMQQTDKTKMYFESCIEYYPESADAYTSMAEYYKAQGDSGTASKFADKANKLRGNE